VQVPGTDASVAGGGEASGLVTEVAHVPDESHVSPVQHGALALQATPALPQFGLTEASHVPLEPQVSPLQHPWLAPQGSPVSLQLGGAPPPLLLLLLHPSEATATTEANAIVPTNAIHLN
jgi:hypothetical protein